jgi:hypothetical protein
MEDWFRELVAQRNLGAAQKKGGTLLNHSSMLDNLEREER